MTFEIGKKFSSFNELQEAVREYSVENKAHYYIRDAKKLGSVGCRNAVTANKDLIYYYIKYTCVKGGRPFKKQNDCQFKRKTTTRRAGCQAFIRLFLTKNGQFLKVKNMCAEHNHKLSKDLFDIYPTERRLPEDIQCEVNDLMKLKLNRNVLISELSKATNKIVLRKDIYNITRKFKKPPVCQEEIIKKLTEENSCDLSILQNDNVLHGIFFQNDAMLEVFSNFPEIILFDGPYTLLNFLCYFFMVEDGSGNREIVGVGLLAKEEEKSLEWLIESFQEKNRIWIKTLVIITDKDLHKISVLKQKFPESKVSICLFHMLQDFEQVISEEMEIKEVQKVEKFLTKITYSESESQFEDNYAEFIADIPSAVREYFDTNWHPFHDEWTLMSLINGNFLKQKHYRLDALAPKLKTIIKPYDNLSTFIDNFFDFLKTLRNERDSIAAKSVLIVSFSNLDETETAYCDLLQPFAFSHLLKQFRAPCVNIVEVSESQFWFSVEGHLFTVTENTCSCIFAKSMKLPCTHIFSLRKQLKLSLFHKKLVSPRWIKNQLTIKQRVLKASQADSGQFEESYPTSHQERYQECTVLTNELADIMSQYTGELYEEKINFIKNLIICWKNEEKTELSSLDDSLKPIKSNELSEDTDSENNENVMVSPTNTSTAIKNKYFKLDSNDFKLLQIAKKRKQLKGFEETVADLPGKRSRKN